MAVKDQVSDNRQSFIGIMTREVRDFSNDPANQGKSGATLHAESIGVDHGARYLITGQKNFRREVKSAVAVYGVLRAAWAAERVWDLQDGGRVLVFERPSAQ